MKVKPATLLLIACAVWSIAGVNILRIGLAAYPAYLGVLNIVLSLVVFCIFQLFVFRKLVRKLRASGIAPERFIAVFYTGLGAALLLAGLLFGRNFGRAHRAAQTA